MRCSYATTVPGSTWTSPRGSSAHSCAFIPQRRFPGTGICRYHAPNHRAPWRHGKSSVAARARGSLLFHACATGVATFATCNRRDPQPVNPGGRERLRKPHECHAIAFEVNPEVKFRRGLWRLLPGPWFGPVPARRRGDCIAAARFGQAHIRDAEFGGKLCHGLGP